MTDYPEDSDSEWETLEPPNNETTPASSLSTIPTQQRTRHNPEVQQTSTEPIRQIQQRMEVNRQIRASLVDKPIQLLWQKFMVHFLKELWDLDISMRVSIAFILLGIFLKSILLSTWYLWYPRVILITLLLAAPWLYLNPKLVQQSIENICMTISSPERMLAQIDQLDTSHVRNITICMLFLPTALELRAVIFLSNVLVKSGSYGSILLTSVTIASISYFLYKIKGCPARECKGKALIILYTAAFFVALVQLHFRNTLFLAAPFFLATGVLLWQSQHNDQWLSQALRNALRSTLRDVLTHLSDTARDDQLVQLAMLRWIAEYWNSNARSRNRSPEERPPQTGASTTSTTEAQSPSMSWQGELLPMLQATTQQMATETQTLQDEGLHHGTAYSTYQMGGTSSPYPQAGRSSADPFERLQSMWLHMNLDERARPAVQAYRRTVYSFPPSRAVAIWVSVSRRCPALLALVYFVLWDPFSIVLAALVLAPIVVLEFFSIQEWVDACRATAELNGDLDQSTEKHDTAFLSTLDPMAIMLSDDCHLANGSPTLLAVWNNVLASVSALETGLIAARCAQTTVAAADFANNILSLANLGIEVSTRGWAHGLALIFREMLVLHSATSNQRVPHESELRYTMAAVDAYRNSRTISRNVQALQEENKGHLVNPFMTTLAVVIGRGWIWGMADPSSYQRNSRSTVVIEELDSEDEDSPPSILNQTGSTDDNNGNALTSPTVSTNCDEEFSAKIDTTGSTSIDISSGEDKGSSLYEDEENDNECETALPDTYGKSLEHKSRSSDKSSYSQESANISSQSSNNMLNDPAEINSRQIAEEGRQRRVAITMELLAQCDERALIDKVSLVAV